MCYFLVPRVSITQGRAYLLVKPQKKKICILFFGSPSRHCSLSSLSTREATKKRRFASSFLAPRVGFEPTAYRLTVECSTAELSGNIYSLRDIKITQVNVLYNMFFSFASVFMKFLNLYLLDFFYLSYSSLK